MSVRSAGLTIKEARTRAGLTLEKLSEGVCSLHSLCRIESGAAGVSPATFQALMEHAGAPCQIYPIFENWNDYQCFYHLTHARFHLNAWQLNPAYEELESVEKLEWNKNKFYYQEWMLLHCKLQFRSGKANHQKNYDDLISALHISRPDISFTSFEKLLLSIHEIELLIAIAQEALYINKPDICLNICRQVECYLSNTNISFLEKDRLLAEHAICYTKYLISAKEYNTAFSLADKYRHQMVLNGDNTTLLELTFLTALGYYYMEDTEKALRMFKDTFYAAHAIESPYATVCRNYICAYLKLSLPEHLLSIPDIPLRSYETKKIIDTSNFTDGIYDIYSTDVVTIGKLIKNLRIKQNVSQQTLCQGLCSKSKLSKIENDTLQPEVILAETLLQRLGFSEREFVFWGNEKEAKFYELKFKLMHESYLSKDTVQIYLFNLENMISEKDILYKQYFLFEKALHINCTEEKIKTLWEAFHCTLKDFEIQNITNYRLSWMELSILNNIAYLYRYTNTPYQSILFLRKILAYQQFSKADIIFQSHIYTITIQLLYRISYVQGHYKEMIDSHNHIDISILRYNLYKLGGYFFYYCQALGECSHFDNFSLFVFYACSSEYLVEKNDNAEILLQSVQKDFNINLVY